MTAASRARVSGSLTGLSSLSSRALSATARASTRRSVAARSSVSTPSRRPAAGSRDRSRRGFSRTLSSAWPSASSSRSISPRSARVGSSHSAARRGSGIGGQAVRHLAEQRGHLPGQVADRVLGRLHPQRREDQARGQPGRRPDQRLGDPAGRGRVRVDREDQHRADRHLQGLLAQAEHQAERERPRDEQAEDPPAERHVGGHRDRGQHARGDADDPLDGAADGMEQGGLHHQERGQRGEHRPGRPARQLQREQVGEDPGQVIRVMYTAAGCARRRTRVSCSAWRLATALAASPTLFAGPGADSETVHERHTEVEWAAGYRNALIESKISLPAQRECGPAIPAAQPRGPEPAARSAPRPGAPARSAPRPGARGPVSPPTWPAPPIQPGSPPGRPPGPPAPRTARAPRRSAPPLAARARPPARRHC